MGTDEIAIQRLCELKSEYITWDSVAEHLSEVSGEPISKTAVWKMAHRRSRSTKILKALGLVEKRYRRTAEFECEEQLQKWDAFMKEHRITLTKLCNGLLDGTVDILVRDDN